MSTAVLIVSLLVAGVSFVTGVWGAWLWWRFAAQDRYWIAIRATQLGALLLAILAGVVWVTDAGGSAGMPWLFWLYCLLPVAISMIAEQLRIISAEQVLERRGLDGAADVERLDEAGQRGIVREIIRREVGIMTASAFVICFLALRITAERGGL